MKVALVQLASPDSESVEARRSRVDRMIRSERSLRDVDLLVLPELWTVGYFSFDEYAAHAEGRDGPTVALAVGWARDLGLSVHLGSFVEANDAGRLHNTSVVVGSAGTVVNLYRKVHLFGYGSRESQLLTPGAEVRVCDLGGLTTGITTCYDLRFPELYRSLLDEGAEQVLVCAAWPRARLEHWRLFTTVRAVEQQQYLLACNAVGDQVGVALGGHSRIVDPTGQIVVEAGPDEGFTYAELDPELPRKARSDFPAVADRRWPADPTAAAEKEIE